MKKITFAVLAITTTALLLLISCQKENGASYTAYKLDLSDAANYNYLDVSEARARGVNTQESFGSLHATNAGITLGRVLFYDTRLSINNSVSCGSCHKQSMGFADGLKVSTGITPHHTPRNSMALSNMGMHQGLFWDLRANTLHEQVTMPIQNHIEMGIENLDHLCAKLEKIDYYPELFEKAFGTREITKEKIAKGLEQFLSYMLSYRSKFDDGRMTNFSNFSVQEKIGMELFNNTYQCSSCHAGVNFAARWTGDAANIGLDFVYEDKGAMNVTGNEFDNGRFKIPSLRNVALTAPYMHDGRFATLEEVIDHYSEGIADNPNLDWRLQEDNNGLFLLTKPQEGSAKPKRLHITPEHKVALIAFLNTLTDHSFIRDPKFSNPFKPVK